VLTGHVLKDPGTSDSLPAALSYGAAIDVLRKMNA
jgi:hypothetical protein